MKRCSSVISHQGNANQNLMRHYFTPTRMAVIRETESVGRDVGTLEPRTLLVGRSNGAAAVPHSLAAAQKVKHSVAERPSDAVLRYMPKRNENI